VVRQRLLATPTLSLPRQEGGDLHRGIVLGKIVSTGPGSIAIEIGIGIEIVVHPEIPPSFASLEEKPYPAPDWYADPMGFRFR